MNSKAVKTRMQALGWTPSSLAAECGIGEYTMQNIMRGMTPRVAVVRLLARNLQTSIKEICPELADEPPLSASNR
jgi:transcriptional regulator with XRE-family HTH domain